MTATPPITEPRCNDDPQKIVTMGFVTLRNVLNKDVCGRLASVSMKEAEPISNAVQQDIMDLDCCADVKEKLENDPNILLAMEATCGNPGGACELQVRSEPADHPATARVRTPAPKKGRMHGIMQRTPTRAPPPHTHNTYTHTHTHTYARTHAHTHTLGVLHACVACGCLCPCHSGILIWPTCVELLRCACECCCPPSVLCVGEQAAGVHAWCRATDTACRSVA